MFKKTDYIIISIICFFLGIFLISQFYTTKEFKKITQPENNEVLAVEVSKLTKVNSDLRREVQDLTISLDSYRSSADDQKKIAAQFQAELDRLDAINGEKASHGQGLIIQVNGNLSTLQIVDLINAIKNIGAETISINNKRILMNTDLSQFENQNSYEIKVLGNSTLLKQAMERKGGIVEQISSKDINFSINSKDDIEIPIGTPIKFIYAKIIE